MLSTAVPLCNISTKNLNNKFAEDLTEFMPTKSLLLRLCTSSNITQHVTYNESFPCMTELTKITSSTTEQLSVEFMNILNMISEIKLHQGLPTFRASQKV